MPLAWQAALMRTIHRARILALLLLAAGVGEHQAAFDGLLRCLVELGFGEEVAAGAFQDLLAAVGALGTPFYTGHRGSPFAYIG